MLKLLEYIIAFTAGLKKTAEAVNEAKTPEELDKKLRG